MKQIKIFRESNLNKLESKVNHWLDNSGARFDTTMKQTFTYEPSKGLNEDLYIITILYMNTYEI